MQKDLESLVNDEIELEAMDIWNADDKEELDSTWNTTAESTWNAT